MSDTRMAEDQDVTTFTIGDSLFLFEDEVVRILGPEGSEAAIPLADFQAFLAHLNDRLLEPAGRVPRPGRKEGG